MRRVLVYFLMASLMLGACNRHTPSEMSFFVTSVPAGTGGTIGGLRFLPHDMLTGSNKDGTLAEGDSTCRGWKSTVGFAVLGHSDKVGTRGPDSNSWNSAHLSEGCTAEAFKGTGGNGLY